QRRPCPFSFVRVLFQDVWETLTGYAKITYYRTYLAPARLPLNTLQDVNAERSALPIVWLRRPHPGLGGRWCSGRGGREVPALWCRALHPSHRHGRREHAAAGRPAAAPRLLLRRRARGGSRSREGRPPRPSWAITAWCASSAKAPWVPSTRRSRPPPARTSR